MSPPALLILAALKRTARGLSAWTSRTFLDSRCSPTYRSWTQRRRWFALRVRRRNSTAAVNVLQYKRIAFITNDLTVSAAVNVLQYTRIAFFANDLTE